MKERIKERIVYGFISCQSLSIISITWGVIYTLLLCFVPFDELDKTISFGICVAIVTMSSCLLIVHILIVGYHVVKKGLE